MIEGKNNRQKFVNSLSKKREKKESKKKSILAHNNLTYIFSNCGVDSISNRSYRFSYIINHFRKGG